MSRQAGGRKSTSYDPSEFEGAVGTKKPTTPLTILRDVAWVVVLGVVLAWLLNNFVVRSFYIPSSSMENTLQINDRIMVSRLTPAVFPVQRGDIVVFKDPGGWLSGVGYEPPANFLQQVAQSIGLMPDTSNQYVVKRVIGVAGDRVKCCDAKGRVTVNGEPLDEDYVTLPENVGNRVSSIDFDVTVPEGSLWVMGDNRYSSKDSRFNQDQPGKGFVPVKDVVGTAFVTTWPLNRFHFILRPDEVFAGVPDPANAGSSSSGGSGKSGKAISADSK